MWLIVVLNQHIRQALSDGRFAHLVTVNADGSPHVTLIWIDCEGDEVVFAHLGSGQKYKNMRRNDRITISLETGGRTGILENYLVLSGHVRITAGGAPELLRKLARVYLGTDEAFPPPDAPPGHVMHLQVEHIGGVGPWKDPA